MSCALCGVHDRLHRHAQERVEHNELVPRKAKPISRPYMFGLPAQGAGEGRETVAKKLTLRSALGMAHPHRAQSLHPLLRGTTQTRKMRLHTTDHRRGPRWFVSSCGISRRAAPPAVQNADCPTCRDPPDYAALGVAAVASVEPLPLPLSLLLPHLATAAAVTMLLSSWP